MSAEEKLKACMIHGADFGSRLEEANSYIHIIISSETNPKIREVFGERIPEIERELKESISNLKDTLEKVMEEGCIDKEKGYRIKSLLLEMEDEVSKRDYKWASNKIVRIYEELGLA